ncbi:hypothetical protein DERF_007040, partial [Dermatophagoides farinae]
FHNNNNNFGYFIFQTIKKGSCSILLSDPFGKKFIRFVLFDYLALSLEILSINFIFQNILQINN